MIDSFKVQYFLHHQPFGKEIVEDGGKRTYYGKVPISSSGKEAKKSPLHAKSMRSGTILQVEGSAAQYFQGFNAFGSCDLQQLLYAVFLEVTKAKNLPTTKADREKVHRGEVRIMRLDIACSVCGATMNKSDPATIILAGSEESEAA